MNANWHFENQKIKRTKAEKHIKDYCFTGILQSRESKKLLKFSIIIRNENQSYFFLSIIPDDKFNKTAIFF